MSLDSITRSPGLEIPTFTRYLASPSRKILTYRKGEWRPMKPFVDPHGYYEVKLRAETPGDARMPRGRKQEE